MTGALPKALVGRNVNLRPLHADDRMTLYAWRVDASEHRSTGGSRRIPTLEQFNAEQEQALRGTIQLLALDPASDEPVGFVQAHSLDLEAGWCFATVYIRPTSREPQVVTEAYAMAFDYAFRHYGLNKVYVEIYEFEEELIRSLFGAGIVQEGRFGAHAWFDGRYWDVIRLAAYRDRWESERRMIPFLLGVGDEASRLLTPDRAEHDDIG